MGGLAPKVKVLGVENASLVTQLGEVLEPHTAGQIHCDVAGRLAAHWLYTIYRHLRAKRNGIIFSLAMGRTVRYGTVKSVRVVRW
jgi:hypothetical protein